MGRGAGILGCWFQPPTPAILKGSTCLCEGTICSCRPCPHPTQPEAAPRSMVTCTAVSQKSLGREGRVREWTCQVGLDGVCVEAARRKLAPGGPGTEPTGALGLRKKTPGSGKKGEREGEGCSREARAVALLGCRSFVRLGPTPAGPPAGSLLKNCHTRARFSRLSNRFPDATA